MHSKGPVEDIRGYNFIDNVLGESSVTFPLFKLNSTRSLGVPKMHVLLMDFDTAMIIQEAGGEKHQHDGTKSVSWYHQMV
jgi:hypothetical protein